MKSSVAAILLVVVGFVLVSHVANAGYIVQGAKITSVSNTNSNGDNFVVWISGGTGPCANTTITFPLNSFASQSAMDRAFTLAVIAQSKGYSVNIYNYSNDTCANASFIVTPSP